MTPLHVLEDLLAAAWGQPLDALQAGPEGHGKVGQGVGSQVEKLGSVQKTRVLGTVFRVSEQHEKRTES